VWRVHNGAELPSTRAPVDFCRWMARYPVEVAYCTDVEGNLSYFERWVETAGRVVRFDSEGKELELVHDGAYFVYGGDVCDNGPGDLRLCQLLVSLKKRHPDRVALLSGNRDLNKLRMTAELDPTDLDRPMDEIAKPHWDVNALTLRQHLERVATQKELPGGVDEANTRIERLKYMLQALRAACLPLTPTLTPPHPKA
jgi:hypothetical protein